MDFDLEELYLRAQTLLAHLHHMEQEASTHADFYTSDVNELATCCLSSGDQMQRDTELAEFMSAQYDPETQRLSSSSSPPPRYSQVMAERGAQQEPLLEADLEEVEAWDADRIAAYQGISQNPGSIGESTAWPAGDSDRRPQASGVPRRKRPIRAKKHEKALRWLAGRRPLRRP